MKAKSVRNRSAGFTLVELMVVVVVIGIIAATILPQFKGTTHDAKLGMAKSHISVLGNALGQFNIHMDRYPTTEEGLKALMEAPADAGDKWRGPYVTIIRPDPWGNPYQYRSPGTQSAAGFDLWSRGSDGQDGGEREAADIGNWQ